LGAKNYRFDEAIKLINAELPVMLEAQKAFFVNWKTSGDKVDADTAIRLLNAAKPTAPDVPALLEVPSQ